MIEIDTMHVNSRPVRELESGVRPKVTALEAPQIVRALCKHGLEVWIDGGWGVDALLGEQTREQGDLDCVIALAMTKDALAALAPLGFVVRDAEDRRDDFHTLSFDDEGGGVQRLQYGASWRYPPQGCCAPGRIAGQSVPCNAADVQAHAHIGYEPHAKDVDDINLVAEHSGIELPETYRKRL